jgi:hypothetical protein
MEKTIALEVPKIDCLLDALAEGRVSADEMRELLTHLFAEHLLRVDAAHEGEASVNAFCTSLYNVAGFIDFYAQELEAAVEIRFPRAQRETVQ